MPRILSLIKKGAKMFSWSKKPTVENIPRLAKKSKLKRRTRIRKRRTKLRKRRVRKPKRSYRLHTQKHFSAFK